MAHLFSVVHLPKIDLVGIHIQTDMKNAEKDCPALWQEFAPRICGELSNCASLSSNGISYGISKMVDEFRFMYWATIGVDAVDSLPEGMESTAISEGFYVKCAVPSLEKLGEVINAMYSEWPQTQDEYALDMQGICFELYPENWQFSDALEVYASVVKK